MCLALMNLNKQVRRCVTIECVWGQKLVMNVSPEGKKGGARVCVSIIVFPPGCANHKRA